MSRRSTTGSGLESFRDIEVSLPSTGAGERLTSKLRFAPHGQQPSIQPLRPSASTRIREPTTDTRVDRTVGHATKRSFEERGSPAEAWEPVGNGTAGSCFDASLPSSAWDTREDYGNCLSKESSSDFLRAGIPDFWLSASCSSVADFPRHTPFTSSFQITIPISEILLILALLEFKN